MKNYRNILKINKNYTGMSLLEVMIASAMLLLTVSAIFVLLHMGINFSRELKLKNEQQQSALVFMSRLTGELNKSAPSSMTFYYPSGSADTGDLALSFMTPLDENGKYIKEVASGLPLYQAYIIYYLDMADNKLKKIRSPIATPTVDVEELPLIDIQNAIAFEAKSNVMKGLKAFYSLNFYSNIPDDKPANPMKFNMKMESENGAPLEFTFTVKIP